MPNSPISKHAGFAGALFSLLATAAGAGNALQVTPPKIETRSTAGVSKR